MDNWVELLFNGGGIATGIIADFERAKPLLYKKNDPITIKSFF